MQIEKTEFDGLLILQPKIFKDERGLFFESWNKSEFKRLGINISFIQDNHSVSKKNVLRGLHFQTPPYAQTKLVRVVKGIVRDVVVDLRCGSPTYGRHEKFDLNEDNKYQLLIPKGFAHGFLVLSDYAIFSYKVDNVYSPNSDSGLKYDDPDLDINWDFNKNHIKISDKDKNYEPFCTFGSPF